MPLVSLFPLVCGNMFVPHLLSWAMESNCRLHPSMIVVSTLGFGGSESALKVRCLCFHC